MFLLLLLFNFALMFCFDFHFKTAEAEIKSGGKESCQVFFEVFFFYFLLFFLPNSFRMQNGNNFSDFRVLNLLLFNELYQLIGLYLVAVFHSQQEKKQQEI